MNFHSLSKIKIIILFLLTINIASLPSYTPETAPFSAISHHTISLINLFNFMPLHTFS